MTVITAKARRVSPLEVARLAPSELDARITGNGEIAVVDVREEGVFSRRHLFFAVNIPLSHLELRLDRLIPRRGTPIVLVDAADGLAERAAERLGRFGYRDVAILGGGVDAWQAAGFELFGGVNVPSKAFGEFVERLEGTPHIAAAELVRMRAEGRPVVVLDSRPIDEFRTMSIPGALDCPGAELVHRIFELAPPPETTVVVNCAGRTRSIIGAQSLINAGIPNKVVALEDGTMGWHLAGFQLDHGIEQVAPAPTEKGRARAGEAAARVAARFGVRRLAGEALARLKGEDDRTLYIFDVRTEEEFEAGHVPGAVWAPGGQLVQATDTFAAVRNARIVLTDDDAVRATLTASWLLQLGWNDVWVLDPEVGKSEIGKAPSLVAGLDDVEVEIIDADRLAGWLGQPGTAVIDLADSRKFRRGHVPHAQFAIRSRLGDLRETLLNAGRVVVTSPDGVLARLGAADLVGIIERPVFALQGGTQAWVAAGHALDKDDGNLPEAPDDVWYRPYDRKSGIEEAMHQYLNWEVGLLAQVERLGCRPFRAFSRVDP